MIQLDEEDALPAPQLNLDVDPTVPDARAGDERNDLFGQIDKLQSLFGAQMDRVVENLETAFGARRQPAGGRFSEFCRCNHGPSPVDGYWGAKEQRAHLRHFRPW